VRMAAVLMLVLFAAACSDDRGSGEGSTTDGPDTTDSDVTAGGATDPPGAGDVEAYCELSDDVDSAALAVISPASSADEVQEAATTFLDDNAALLDQITVAAPDEIVDAHLVTLDYFEELARTGDLSLLTEPDAAEADQSVSQFMAEKCGGVL